ncbi:hypothetical protein MTP99_011658 [Tenebrio molitor]|nr:hypothetical protein MTP99_011658 [Tenebrio molitor]
MFVGNSPEASHSRVVQAATEQRAMASLAAPRRIVSPRGRPREAGPWRRRSQHWSVAITSGALRRPGGQQCTWSALGTAGRGATRSPTEAPSETEPTAAAAEGCGGRAGRAGARVETSRYCG